MSGTSNTTPQGCAAMCGVVCAAVLLNCAALLVLAICSADGRSRSRHASNRPQMAVGLTDFVSLMDCDLWQLADVLLATLSLYALLALVADRWVNIEQPFGPDQTIMALARRNDWFAMEMELHSAIAELIIQNDGYFNGRPAAHRRKKARCKDKGSNWSSQCTLTYDTALVSHERGHPMATDRARSGNGSGNSSRRRLQWGDVSAAPSPIGIAAAVPLLYVPSICLMCLFMRISYIVRNHVAFVRKFSKVDLRKQNKETNGIINSANHSERGSMVSLNATTSTAELRRYTTGGGQVSRNAVSHKNANDAATRHPSWRQPEQSSQKTNLACPRLVLVRADDSAPQTPGSARTNSHESIEHKPVYDLPTRCKNRDLSNTPAAETCGQVSKKSLPENSRRHGNSFTSDKRISGAAAAGERDLLRPNRLDVSCLQHTSSAALLGCGNELPGLGGINRRRASTASIADLPGAGPSTMGLAGGRSSMRRKSSINSLAATLAASTPVTVGRRLSQSEMVDDKFFEKVYWAEVGARTESLKAELSAAKVVHRLVLCYTVCWLPLLLVWPTRYLPSVSGARRASLERAIYLCTWLNYCAAVFNPLLYTLSTTRLAVAARRVRRSIRWALRRPARVKWRGDMSTSAGSTTGAPSWAGKGHKLSRLDACAPGDSLDQAAGPHLLAVQKDQGLQMAIDQRAPPARPRQQLTSRCGTDSTSPLSVRNDSTIRTLDGGAGNGADTVTRVKPVFV